MKLNLDIELDWIDEEMNLDETVKQNVINAVVDKIQKNVEKQIEEKVNKTIDMTVIGKINEMTENLFNDFMNREVCINDGYGSKIKVYPDVTAVIKERFDNFMTQRVDNEGRATESTYGTTYQRLVYIVDKQLKGMADKFTTDAVKQVSEEIKTHVTNGLTNKLGAELMKILKVDQILQLKK